jgi:hypothetical protein
MQQTMTGRTPWNNGRPWPKQFKMNASKWAITNGHTFKERGGNGRGPSKAEFLVQTCLPRTFIYSYPVALGARRRGYPTNYKIDFGDPKKKLAIEVDGVSHKRAVRKAQDKKKETKLRSLGWKVCRISNAEVFRLSTISKLKTVLTSKLRNAR